MIVPLEPIDVLAGRRRQRNDLGEPAFLADTAR